MWWSFRKTFVWKLPKLLSQTILATKHFSSFDFPIRTSTSHRFPFIVYLQVDIFPILKQQCQATFFIINYPWSPLGEPLWLDLYAIPKELHKLLEQYSNAHSPIRLAGLMNFNEYLTFLICLINSEQLTRSCSNCELNTPTGTINYLLIYVFYLLLLWYKILFSYVIRYLLFLWKRGKQVGPYSKVILILIDKTTGLYYLCC